MKAKNIGLLATLAMVVTVGGVYATWNYAVNKINSTIAGVSVGIADINPSEKGTISATSNLELIIDDTNGDYVAEITWAGQIDVTFTPGAGYDSDDKIDLQYSVAINGDKVYDGSAILVSDGTKYDFASDLNDANNTASITSLSGVTLGKAFSLPTADDYDAFKTELTGASITVTISEK